ncbi:urea ABC transporter ATP-binding protein UrtD [Chromobacterium haemolyticum]|uniref:urea ABC transporter ATP-binding protein UrtD n=1 Tax=Chromobacterium TaxID=535 RepID=UPI0040570DB2
MNATSENPAPRGQWEGEAVGLSRPLTPGLDIRHGQILYLDDVIVDFDSYRALNRLTLSIAVGELRVVIGPNGAGKTTMMDVITGKTRPDAGSVFFGQTIDLRRHDEAEIAQLGIGRKFQKPTVFEAMTVADNLELALAGDRSVRASLRARLGAAPRRRIDELLERVRLQDQRGRLAGLLSHGQKQWLEIGMLLAQQPKLLLLDEPVAGMSDAETEQTAELLLSLKGEHSLMVVEHDMDFVASLGGKVTVLAEGAVLAEGTLRQVQADERVIEVYLGR